MVNNIGVFYSTPFGVVKTYSWDGHENPPIIGWFKIKKVKRFENVYSYGHTPQPETVDWVKLDLVDFPESVDAVLPYSFDLFFDIKRMSQLRRAFRHEDSDELLEMMRNHNVRFKRSREVST